MNEIIQGLEVNATNGKENFCYISENKLKAIKELSKREQQENQSLKDRIEKVSKKLELLLNDLKINSEAETESGKSYFNTQLFAIRVKEVYKALKGDK